MTEYASRQEMRYVERNRAKVRKAEDRVVERTQVRKSKKLSALSREDAKGYPDSTTVHFEPKGKVYPLASTKRGNPPKP